jgi:hypothetical protein
MPQAPGGGVLGSSASIFLISGAMPQAPRVRCPVLSKPALPAHALSRDAFVDAV